MRILIAEDEITTAKALKVILEKNRFSVDIVHNGDDAWNYIRTGTYEVIVLDIMMPGMNGLEVLAKTRENNINTPVLMLTAKSEIEDKVAGLEAGADDYLAKPFATSELIARIKALGRRSEVYSDSLRKAGNVILDSNRYELRSGNNTVSLTNKEFQLLELFIMHPGFVFSTEHLMDKIWGLDSESDIDVVWTHIGFVRKKLKTVGANVEIKTIRGAGYSLEVNEC
ncbi:DNA-binding response regulator, OmpR family, contains REC and winged-helix (wHTH) domain [Ruminococcaceae bacterium YRB3002]|nr:DNA-binding response regulator, OmpR family, contains REC and winged-helix (wHTH) domain [Ruminococcaceae bacterium YRB3002]